MSATIIVGCLLGYIVMLILIDRECQENTLSTGKAAQVKRAVTFAQGGFFLLLTIVVGCLSIMVLRKLNKLF